MTLIGLQDAHKTYGEAHLLRGVSLQIGELERVGLLGANGCGKSTLLKILAGAEQADEGTRTVMRGRSVGYLEQEPELAPDHRVRDAVRAGLGRRSEVLHELEQVHALLAEEQDANQLDKHLKRQARLDDELAELGGHDIEHRIEDVLMRLGLRDPEATCGTLSGGEKRRVALARLLLQAPDLLLLDEPTNHLDAIATEWLENYLLNARTTLVMVTHDRYFLDRVVDRIIELDRGELHFYDGGYHDFLVQRTQRLEREQKSEQTRLNLLRRESEWMRRGPPARTTKAKARIGRYRELVDGAAETGPRDLEFEIPGGPRLGQRVLELSGVTKAYGDRVVIPPLDLELRPGDRLGIVGPNGAGKTTLVKLCTGELAPDTGTVTRGSTVRFAAIDQTRSDLDPTATVLEEVAGPNDHVTIGGRAVRIEGFLERFLFAGAMMHTAIGDLSGGERNRVLLAKLLTQGGNVLVLDEPTNDLDLMTLRVLEEALVAFPGAALVVSHDRYFLDRVATRILHFDGRGALRVHEGDLSLLLEILAREEVEKAKPAPAKTRTPAARPAAPSGPKLSWDQQKELEKLPARIEEAETALGSIDARLADPALYGGQAEELAELTRQRTAAQSQLDELYARWEQLESIREAGG